MTRKKGDKLSGSVCRVTTSDFSENISIKSFHKLSIIKLLKHLVNSLQFSGYGLLNYWRRTSNSTKRLT